MNPNSPTVSGTNQGPDLFSTKRNGESPLSNSTVRCQEVHGKINQLRGTDYDLVSYYGHPEAEHIIVAMGSVAPTICQTIDYLIAKGKKLVLFKFIFIAHFQSLNFRKNPKTVQTVAVLDRTKESGALGEPLL